jgi:hypothetical protein
MIATSRAGGQNGADADSRLRLLRADTYALSLIGVIL